VAAVAGALAVGGAIYGIVAAVTGGTASFTTVEEMREAVESIGFPCTDWSVDFDTPAGPSATCAWEPLVMFVIFTDPSDVEKNLGEGAERTLDPGDSEFVVLAGPNWGIGCDDVWGGCGDLVQKWQKTLGGGIYIYPDL
jgi:hypothetical protein